ncbi:sterol desaturase family protein [Streptomyces hygroscopicus]|uniref:sterol desaturase family protein n=1 Tax=Streptomyces hygroscopicus TaxID=1912 RepID=UPI0036BD1556
MPHLPNAVQWSIPAFVLLTVVEMVSYRLHPDEDAEGYAAKDAATSVTMGLGSLVFDLMWKIPIVAVYTAVHELTPLRVPVEWWTLPLMLLAQDFSYYWSHRGHHVVRILWACHVVHHSSRRFNLYLDRNFGGILIVWDRLFRTFVPETERPVYGLTKNIDTYNPLRVATHEYVAIARDVAAARGWRERAGRVFAGPGWRPGPAPEAVRPDPVGEGVG